MSNTPETIVDDAHEPAGATGNAEPSQVYAEARRRALEWMGERYLLANPVTRLDQALWETDRKA